MRITFFVLFISVICACKQKQTSDVVPVATDTAQAEVKINPDPVPLVLTRKLLLIIKSKDYASLAEFVHPTEGVRFSPYAYIDTTKDIRLKREVLTGALNNKSVYQWGNFDGSGEPIRLTIDQYFEKFVYNHDFLPADELTLNKSNAHGNSTNNLKDVYKDGEYTESYFKGFDQAAQGMDWNALRLVFRQYEGTYYLVGVVHDQWTI